MPGDRALRVGRDQPFAGAGGGATPEASALAEHLAAVFGGSLRAVLHYGSRAQGRASRHDSPFDFFVIVTGYRDAYRAAEAAIGGCRPRRAVVLSWVLPPNAIAVRQRGPFGEREAKCMLVSERDFRRECSARARDHFVQTRMTQRVLLVWSRDDGSAEAVGRGVEEARERTAEWLPAFLPSPFAVPDYCRAMIEVCLAHEIRAEAKGHAMVLFAAQREALLAIYGPVLERLTKRGVLEHDGERYRWRHPPGPIARLRVRGYFRWSKVRTTLRLLKHPFLYDDWLDYLTRKIDRSTGERIELTELERRRPLIFLWPRVLRYLRGRPQRQH